MAAAWRTFLFLLVLGIAPANAQDPGILLRQKWSRGQVEARLANIPPCLIGMEACVGAHHLSRTVSLIMRS